MEEVRAHSERCSYDKAEQTHEQEKRIQEQREWENSRQARKRERAEVSVGRVPRLEGR